MQIKTILVHMTRSHDAGKLMEAACALARKYNAHLIGMAAFSASIFRSETMRRL